MAKNTGDNALLLVVASVIAVAAVMFVLSLWLGGNKPIALGSVEVRQYHGKALSSINDIQQNAINGIQHINISDYNLVISGLVDRPQNLSYPQVLGFQAYSKVVTLNCVEGWSATILWQGVLISDLIDRAGAQPAANTVIFTGSDGYTTSLPLDYVRNNHILLAYQMNNVTIPTEQGFPFMVVAEDKYGYKWAKWVTGIELSNDPSYKGYWESRGYSNNGDINGSMYG
jgi:DMSO/TMAO reductase YedYZ molybdopterin-dependent catalytic subunit